MQKDTGSEILKKKICTDEEIGFLKILNLKKTDGMITDRILWRFNITC